MFMVKENVPPQRFAALHNKTRNVPEDVILEAISRMPHFDWRAAWKEVEHERVRERP